jgi:hypothetical protein
MHGKTCHALLHSLKMPTAGVLARRLLPHFLHSFHCCHCCLCCCSPLLQLSLPLSLPLSAANFVFFNFSAFSFFSYASTQRFGVVQLDALAQ